MRADRLLKMMLILQTRGRQTARSLAAELEVSERTVYRDVVALSISGIPIYTEKGPGGGIQLIDEYRTSLTGLSSEEVKALFMVKIPAVMTNLGIGAEIKSAWLKLSASLPHYLQEAETGVRQRIMIDQTWWQETNQDNPSFLRELYKAVWEDRVIEIVVEYGFGFSTEHQVEAYSLIAQGQRWFLVCRIGNHFKIFWLPDIKKLTVTPNQFQRDPDFDLGVFWQEKSQLIAEAFSYRADLLLTKPALEKLSYAASVEICAVGEKKPDDWIKAKVRFNGFDAARSMILGLGSGAKILAPEALIYAVKDYAQQVLRQYEHS
jgi:predicted DNA-binding transcriptional regulator YafY